MCVYDMLLPSTVVVEGCRVFADYISKHNGQVPKWVVAAFWWLSYAIDGSLSVDDWTAAIELYSWASSLTAGAMLSWHREGGRA
jgi:hypothetical protein